MVSPPLNLHSKNDKRTIHRSPSYPKILGQKSKKAIKVTWNQNFRMFKKKCGLRSAVFQFYERGYSGCLSLFGDFGWSLLMMFQNQLMLRCLQYPHLDVHFAPKFHFECYTYFIVADSRPCFVYSHTSV